MRTVAGIHEELAFVSNLRGLVTAYEEIAVTRIERVRKSVLDARSFREGLSSVYSDVQTVNQQQIAAILAKKKELKKKQKEVAVLLSTNTRLSGKVTSTTTRYYIEQVQKRNADIMVIGQVGKEQVHGYLPDSVINFFPLPTSKPTPDEVSAIVDKLLEYEAVSLYFARFQNLVNQEPTMIELGDIEAMMKVEKQPESSIVNHYIFEPSLEEVIDFFNKQIFAMLVQQTFDESWLSLLGSRITAMEQASGNIQGQLQHLIFEERLANRNARSRKQRDRLAGISLWYN